MTFLYHRIYLAGHGRWVMPKSIRKRVARSEIHRAWFLGFNGYFEEGGVSYGLSNPYGGTPEEKRGCPIHMDTHGEGLIDNHVEQANIDARAAYYDFTGATVLDHSRECDEEKSK